MRPTNLADLTWPEAAELLSRDDRLIIVSGATEQHGRHLPLGTDVRIPLELAARLSARSGVPIAPPLWLGASESHMAFPGTLTLTEETLRSLYLETIQSSYRHGWRRLFVLNGHGGNRTAWEWVARLAAKVKEDLRIYLTHWWTEDEGRALVAARTGRNEGHAGLEESAAMLVAAPTLVRLEAAVGQSTVEETIWEQPADALRAALPDGAIGVAPGEATPALGAAMLDLLVERYAALLEGEWS